MLIVLLQERSDHKLCNRSLLLLLLLCSTGNSPKELPNVFKELKKEEKILKTRIL